MMKQAAESPAGNAAVWQFFYPTTGKRTRARLGTGCPRPGPRRQAQWRLGAAFNAATHLGGLARPR